MFDFEFDAANDSGIFSELSGKRVFIAGSCGPLAYEVTSAFVRQGCQLVLHAPDAEQAQRQASAGINEDMYALGDKARTLGGDVRLLPCDFSDNDSVIRFAQTAARVYGGLDVIITLTDIELTAQSVDACQGDVEQLVADTVRPAFSVAEACSTALMGKCYEAKLIHAVSLACDQSNKAFAAETLIRGALQGMTAEQNDRWYNRGISVQTLISEYEHGTFGCFRELGDATCNIARGKNGWFDGKTLSMQAAEVA